MTDTKYLIDIETPEGVLVKSDQHEDTKKQFNVDVELPAGYVVTEEGVVEAPHAEPQYVEPLLAQKRQHMGMKAKKIISNTIIYIVLIAMSIIWIVPFFCIVFESFRVGEFVYDEFGAIIGTKPSTSQVGYIIPQVWGFDNYINLFKTTDFGRWLLNTFIMGLVVSVVQTIIVLAVSYSLSRVNFKGRKGLMNFMLILGMFPGFLTLILLFRLLSDLNMTGSNSIFGLILVYVGSSGMGYYVSKGFFDTIPKSLDEAARIDGATRAQVMFKVILPLAKPIVIYTILMGFMAPWGDFVLAKYIAHSTSKGMNVAVGLQNLISTPQSLAANYTMFCAGGVIVAIPITLLFMFLQKYYVEGVTGGAVKG